MKWNIKISKEAQKEYKSLDKGIRLQVLAGILKVSKNPLPRPNGYGKPLGNKQGKNLTGFFKIKYNDIGIRVVYTLVSDEHIMNVIVVSERSEDFCYEMAVKLYEKYGAEVFKDIFENHEE